MKKIVIAVALSSLFCVGAKAADLHVAPTYKAPPAPLVVDPWVGFYIGANLGYGFDLSGMTAAQPPFFTGAQLATAPQGFTGGVQAGYNFRLGSSLFLMGIDADLNGGALKGTAAAPEFITGTSEMNWFGSVGGRVGITPFQNLFVYGFGGLAFGDPNNTFTLSNFVNTGATCVGTCTVTDSGTRTGPAWGFGMEFALDQHWKLGADWRRYDFGTSNLSMTPEGTTTITFSPQNRFDIFRARLNYTF